MAPTTQRYLRPIAVSGGRLVWTLNIGLGAPRYRERTIMFEKRLKGALSWIADHMQTCYFEWQRPHHGEHVLVVEGQLRDYGPGYSDSAAEMFGKLADAAEQDCVAVSWSLAGVVHGALFGVHADKWAPFDPALFRQPTRKVFH